MDFSNPKDVEKYIMERMDILSNNVSSMQELNNSLNSWKDSIPDPFAASRNINNNLTSKVNEVMDSIDPWTTTRKEQSTATNPKNQEKERSFKVKSALKNWLHYVFDNMNSRIDTTIYELTEAEIKEICTIKVENKHINFFDKMTGKSKQIKEKLIKDNYKEFWYNNIDKKIEIEYDERDAFDNLTEHINPTELLCLAEIFQDYQNQIIKKSNELKDIAQKNSIDLSKLYSRDEDFEYNFKNPSKANKIRREYCKLCSQEEILNHAKISLLIDANYKKLVKDIEDGFDIDKVISQKLGSEVLPEINSISDIKLEENIFDQLKSYEQQQKQENLKNNDADRSI